MTDKKKEKVYALTVRMSKENLYLLKEAAIKERMSIREYVHRLLGLEMEEKK